MSRVYDYLEKLEKDKQLFVDILNSKDISSSSDETFSTLVPKVSSMVDINGYYDLTKKTSGGIISYIKQIPMIDTSGYTSMYFMFENCSSLTTIPLLDTSKVTNMNGMFYNCKSLTTIPLLDTSKVTEMSNMFFNCSVLETIPQLDTSNVTNIGSIFQACNSLQTIPQLNANKIQIVGRYTFQNCRQLKNLGGFLNLGQAYSTTQSANYYDYALNLSYTRGLTHDSLMNVINNLYDIASAGIQPQQLQLGSTNLAKLTEEEIAIATNKGWNVVA